MVRIEVHEFALRINFNSLRKFSEIKVACEAVSGWAFAKIDLPVAGCKTLTAQVRSKTTSLFTVSTFLTTGFIGSTFPVELGCSGIERISFATPKFPMAARDGQWQSCRAVACLIL